MTASPSPSEVSGPASCPPLCDASRSVMRPVPRPSSFSSCQGHRGPVSPCRAAARGASGQGWGDQSRLCVVRRQARGLPDAMLRTRSIWAERTGPVTRVWCLSWLPPLCHCQLLLDEPQHPAGLLHGPGLPGRPGGLTRAPPTQGRDWWGFGAEVRGSPDPSGPSTRLELEVWCRAGSRPSLRAFCLQCWG